LVPTERQRLAAGRVTFIRRVSGASDTSTWTGNGSKKSNANNAADAKRMVTFLGLEGDRLGRTRSRAEGDSRSDTNKV
jgi:hypothetical protein